MVDFFLYMVYTIYRNKDSGRDRTGVKNEGRRIFERAQGRDG